MTDKRSDRLIRGQFTTMDAGEIPKPQPALAQRTDTDTKRAAEWRDFIRRGLEDRD